jgi:DNA-binding beta-propeller fold protein YncE
MRALLLPAAAISLAFCQTPERPVRAVTDPGVITTRQAIAPAGVPAIFSGRVYGVAFGAGSEEVWVLNAQRLYRMNWRENRVVESQPHKSVPGRQGIAFDPSSGAALITATDPQRGDKGPARLLRWKGGEVERLAPGAGRSLTGAPAIVPGKLAIVPATGNNKIDVYDLASGTLKGSIDTGVAPSAAVVSRDGAVAWVSNWGGRRPKLGEKTGATGMDKDSDRVVVDDRGIAASGTVMRIDLNAMRVTHELEVGLGPTGLAWDEKAQRLYAANSNGDSITVVETALPRVLETIEVQPFARRVQGIAPGALALAPGGKRLFAACGGINAVAVYDAASMKLEGLIPTAWYPSSLSVSADGSHLAVGALLGAGSGWRDEPRQRFVHAYRGSVHVVPMPDSALLAQWTRAAAENNHLPPAGAPAEALAPRPGAAPKAIPERVGEPSKIKHVVYIVKENRTYDQLFGDLERGNGDPSLVLFGAPVAPNHRRLALQFALFDNFYATGGNSADGHQWLTQGNETAYALWPGYTGRSYPYNGTDPIAYSYGGFLWDAALKKGKTVRVFGEFAGSLAEPPSLRHELLAKWKAGEDLTTQWNIRAPIESLNRILSPAFPPYSNAIPDVVRAQIFLKELAQWEKDGAMPNLSIMLLPCDHTYGTTPGASTPRAMVADNDLALGRIVEALTRSRFWPEMAIFIVEDDAQNGVDHVDGHRTVALAVSPYIRRGAVDSTFYSQQSMLKTIELILGIEPLSLFNLIASDMRAAFTDTPDLSGYAAAVPEQDLFERNPELKALRGEARRAAADSAKMNWNLPDAAPYKRLNRILWHSIKGWNTPYPGARQAAFAPMAVEADEDGDGDDR